jgi:hypothetical protein
MGIACIWYHKRSGTFISPKTCSQFHAVKLPADFLMLLILRWPTLGRLPSQYVVSLVSSDHVINCMA